MKKDLCQLFFIYFFLLLTFISGLTLVSFIPNSLLKVNIGRSINELEKEGIYPTFGLPFRKIIIDNFTNALMLNIAYSVDEKAPFSSAMKSVYYDSKFDKNNQILNLKMLYQGKEKEPVFYYRYWHGYLLYIRPLLIFFSYSQIRLIFMVILYLLFIIFISHLWKKYGKKISLAFLLGFLAVDYFFLGWSPSFFGSFFVGLSLVIIFLLKKEKIKNPLNFFYLAGALTSFFDLLTAPLVPFGLLLLSYYHIYKIYKKNSFKQLLLVSFYWMFGYISIWLSKWVLVELLFFKGAIKAGLSQVLYRSLASPDSQFTHLTTLKRNLFQLIGYDKTNKLFVFFIFVLALFYLLKNFHFKTGKIRKIYPLFFIAIIPYLWYLIAANHSYIHVWFTYRNQLMTVVALVLIYFQLLEKT